jgi:hypothetical protein
LDRTGFAIAVTTFLQARDPFAICAQKKLGCKSAPRERESLALKDAEQKTDQNFTVLSAMVKAGLKSKPKLNPIEYARRLAVEKALQQRRYCDALALWRTCSCKACRRQRCCCGEAAGCLRRALDRVPHSLQWRARQDILETTARNIGAPERAARQCMPRDLYD